MIGAVVGFPRLLAGVIPGWSTMAGNAQWQRLEVIASHTPTAAVVRLRRRGAVAYHATQGFDAHHVGYASACGINGAHGLLPKRGFAGEIHAAT